MTDPPAKLLQSLSNRLYQLVDDDPLEAITQARGLRASNELSEEEVDGLRAAILVDAGGDLRDEAAVAEGVAQFRSLVDRFPGRLDLRYNLANGLSALAHRDTTRGWDWYRATGRMRREARSLYSSVAHDTSGRLASRAFANLGNLLQQSFRLLEAHDAYMASVTEDPSNSVAWSGAAKVLRTFADWRIGSVQHLEEIVEAYLVRAEKTVPAEAPGQRRARRAIEEMKTNSHLAPKLPDLRDTEPYVRWVAEKRLSLSPTIVGLPPDIKRWDTLTITSITEDLSAPNGVPPIFALFNTLKADYIVARWLAYRALEEPPEETGYYADTLDYANYGAAPSALTLAHRATIDILDRIAVAASHYFALPGSVRDIYFLGRWHVAKGGKLAEPLEWQQLVADQVASGNLGILALTEIAEDIASGGSLAGQRSLRHSTTHRFVVLHDMLIDARTSEHVERWRDAEFRSVTVEALQIVRAALFYFLQAINISEHRKKTSSTGLILPLVVPPHHWIRGEDAETAH